MRTKEILKLVAGFRRFKMRYFDGDDSVYHRKLSQGQTPKTLIIACSDSRVDPAIISSASPGELFVVRNVANLVPPYETTGNYHGVSAAIEFAVTNLLVENIVVLGHRQCGGIRALMNSDGETKSFVGRWVSIAAEAKRRVLERHAGLDPEALCSLCEREAIQVSIANLRTFGFVQKAVQERGLNLYGIYFDLEEGQLMELDESSGQFQTIQI